MDRIDKLKKIMKEKGLSQEAVARELEASVMTVFRWLHRKTTPKGLSAKVLDEWIENNK